MSWRSLGALPPSLLLLIAHAAWPAYSQDVPWPYNLPADMKYYPEHEHLVKRDLRIQQKLQISPATGVRKMSPDPGEKFFLQYWSFAEEEDYNDTEIYANSTVSTGFDQSVRAHSSRHLPRIRLPGFHLFAKRDFTCPAGYFSCANIEQPQACCATGSTCQIVRDTGNGDVGCCPQGGTCGGELGDCLDGYTACPNVGGGCCLPGYACVEGGCVQTSTVLTNPPQPPRTTTVTSYTTITPSQPTTSTSPTTISSPSSSTPSATILPPVINTVTVTVTRTSSAPPSCSSGYRSCPATLGGGCCPTDRSCGSANCPASSTSTSTSASPLPPVRPTTDITTTETTIVGPSSSSTSSSIPIPACPTGFYACSAIYNGGCCQTGRDCAETSCPATPSLTVVSGATLTIVAPSGLGITSAALSATGACAQGWATCAPNLGGGCCPSGYACESATCAATAGGSDVGKQAPVGMAVRLGMSEVQMVLVAGLVGFLAWLL